MIEKIFGPPGTGKTSTLLNLFEKELKEVESSRIAFLTFTRSARLEALRRIRLSEAELPYLKTIHSICYRQLGLTQKQIIKPRDLRYFGKQIGEEITGSIVDPWAVDEFSSTQLPPEPTRADLLLQINHLGRHRMVNLNEMLRDAPEEIDFKYAKWFTLAYRNWKNQENMYDYTDLLTRYLELGKELDIEVLFVDEAQDLSLLQWEVVHKLGRTARRTYIAGDDDQAIFTWAGADAQRFLAEPSDHDMVLEKSHRLPSDILDIALRITSRISGDRRMRKEIRSRDGATGEVRDIGYLDGSVIRPTERTFILFRNHHRGAQLRKELLEQRDPFIGTSAPLSDDSVRAALVGMMDLNAGRAVPPRQAWAIVNATSAEFLADQAVMNAHDTKNPITRDRILRTDREWPEVLHRLRNLDYLVGCFRRFGWSMLDTKTVLMSIHQSKGHEADTVILDTDMARKTYDGWIRNEEDEHRVWYVAVTRARERLLVMAPQSPMAYSL